jgi:tetratricopeptide (TPR) repeat protein
MSYGVLFSSKLVSRGEFDEAIVKASEEIAASPDEPEPLFNRGQALVALGRFAEAVIDYEAALARDATASALDLETDDDELFFALRSLAQSQKERPVEAIATIERYRAVLPAGRHLDDIKTWVDHINGVATVWVRERV